MSAKGRRNRSKRNRAKARAERSLGDEHALESLAPAFPSRGDTLEASPGVDAELSDAVPPSAAPMSDLDAHFFDSSTSEAWLAQELELRDPRFLRKMTAAVAHRRARLAKYVVGVLAVAAALGLAALLKSAVP
jgi:hypothetical protein